MRFGYAHGINPGVLSYDADAQSFFNQLGSPPTGGFKNAINNMIVRLKADSLWGKIGVLYVLGSENEADYIYNLKNPGGTAITNTGPPTWTQYRGTAGNGTSSYHDTGITFSTIPFLAADDSSLFALYTTAPAAGVTGPIIGDPSNQSFRLHQNVQSTWIYKLEQTVSVAANNATPYQTAPHLLHATRVGATSSFAYYDGAQDETESAQASDGTIPATNMLIHSFAGTFGNMRINIVGAGGGFSAAQAANLATTLLAADAALAAL